MSSLTGHAKITSAAVREVTQEMKFNPLATGMTHGGLPAAAVTRDIIDVICLGHWADFGQKHHFMRQFDSQSPFEAYESAVEWIRKNAYEAAQAIAARTAAYYPNGINGSRNPQLAGQTVYRDLNLQSLGNAVHALEDSFAPGHVTRGPGSPGPITHIKRYAGAEKNHHAEGDDQWQDGNKGFSEVGRLAIDAVKALLKIVVLTASSNAMMGTLVDWQAFRDKWLKADAKLSKSKDRVFDLIDQYYTGVRLGATNIKTFDMNEEGLAKALFSEDPATTLAVFVRLDEQYNSDADDVAEIYVNLIRKAGGAKLAELRGNELLIRRLIKVMNEGRTSSGEQECIDFLKGLL